MKEKFGIHSKLCLPKKKQIVEDAGLDINIDNINKVDTGFDDVNSDDDLTNMDKMHAREKIS